MKFELKKKLVARSERVKSVDFHPTLPWILIGLYNGAVSIYDYNSQNSLQYIEISNKAIRAVKFIPDKSLFICGADDLKLRIYNYNTMEKIREIEAHSDLIRSICIHQKQNLIISCSDDQTIVLWDLEKDMANIKVYEEHSSYVMRLALNPKDQDMFASASTDKKIKVWNFNNRNSSLTIEGHTKGVISIAFCPHQDKPYLASGSDDRTIKIWDYTNKMCIATLESHEDSVCSIGFHPELPIIISGSEDYYCKFWNTNTFKLEDSKMFGYDTIWDIASQPDQNMIALGCEDATIVLRMGSEFPLAIFSQPQSKIIYSKQNSLCSINLKTLQTEDIKDGESINYTAKNLGSTELFPVNLKFSSNGRYFSVLSDKDFVISTSGVYRDSCVGSCTDLAWNTGNDFIVKDGSALKFYKNLKEEYSFKPGFTFDGIFSGPYFSVKTNDSLYFYDYESKVFIRKIDIVPINVVWSENKKYVSIICDETTYILKCNEKEIENHIEKVSSSEENDDNTEIEDCEESFTFFLEIKESIISGIWFEDVFIYLNNKNKLNYTIEDKTFTITTLNGNYFLLGYYQLSNKLFFMSKNFKLITYYFPISFIYYQSYILKKEYETAEKVS
jgi:coatomer subunit beta'